MIARTRTLSTACFLLLARLFVACSDDTGATSDFPGACEPGDSLEGVWTIFGQGTRTNCENKRLDGQVFIDITGLVVDERVQNTTPCGDDGQASDAFAECIRSADIQLLSGARTGPEAEPVFAGVRYDDDCYVSFKLSEVLEDGQRLDYLFEGDRNYRGASGDFTGTGPDGCVLKGEFTVRVR